MLHTHRLIARPLYPEDFQDLCRLHEDAQVMEFAGGVRTEEQTRIWLQDNLRHWTAHEFGLWVFRHPVENAFVGRCGLRRARLDGADEVELGYSLMPQYWGQGLATEMGAAMLTIGFESIGLRSVVALIHARNERSRRVAERLDLRFERETAWKGAQAMLHRKVGDPSAKQNGKT